MDEQQGMITALESKVAVLEDELADCRMVLSTCRMNTAVLHKDPTAFRFYCGVNGSIRCNHACYYQIQTQTSVCGADFCDVYVCLPVFTENGQNDLHVERIIPDEPIFNTCLQRARDIFKSTTLSELVAEACTSKGSGLGIAQESRK